MNRTRIACILALIALTSLSRGESADVAVEKPIPKPRQDPEGWFSRSFQVGSPCPAMWSPDHAPRLLTGAEIIAMMEADTLSSSVVASDPELKKSITSEGKYWYWTKQGPMSDRQMHVIMKGETALGGLIVYARIQQRPCM